MSIRENSYSKSHITLGMKLYQESISNISLVDTFVETNIILKLKFVLLIPSNFSKFLKIFRHRTIELLKNEIKNESENNYQFFTF